MWDTNIISKHKCKYKTHADGYTLSLFKEKDSLIPQIFGGGILIDA